MVDLLFHIIVCMQFYVLISANERFHSFIHSFKLVHVILIQQLYD